MSDNVAGANPEGEFVRPCNLCPHMKRITLDGILESLETGQHVVTVDPVIAERARAAVERMIALPDPAVPASFDGRTGRDVVAVERR